MTNTNRNQAPQWRKLFIRLGLLIAVPALIAINQGMSETPAVGDPMPAVAVDRAYTGSEAGTIAEDDPRWDCRTMGNRVCGEGNVVDGVPVPAGDYSSSTACRVEDFGSAGAPLLVAVSDDTPDGLCYQTACWVEHKAGGEPDELISGDVQLMPVGSTVVPCDQAPALAEAVSHGYDPASDVLCESAAECEAVYGVDLAGRQVSGAHA